MTENTHEVEVEVVDPKAEKAAEEERVRLTAEAVERENEEARKREVAEEE